jgi:hypothetical protein
VGIHDGGCDTSLRYRLEVAGRVDPGWIAWFEADRVIPMGSNTLLELRVADQSQLYGRLRRIHDLNLRLLWLRRVDPDPK